MTQPNCEDRISAALVLLEELRDHDPAHADDITAIMEELRQGSGDIDNPGGPGGGGG